MKPPNFTSGLVLFVATMAATYAGTSLGENSEPRPQLSTVESFSQTTAQGLGQPYIE